MEAGERIIEIQEVMDVRGVRFGTSGVRGLVADMTSDVCFAYTSAFLKTQDSKTDRVALAIDLRPSSPTIAAACVAAIEHAGHSVEFCGAIPTPALAHYTLQQAMPGVMVTGSHIPFDRNGIKFYSPHGEITKNDEASIAKATVSVPNGGLVGTLPQIDGAAHRAYLDRYLEFFPEKCLSGMRLGIFEHSSVARDLLRQLLERLGAEIISLGRTDEFVPIDTEAVSDHDTRQARLWAEQYRFDAVLSTDGDGDRPLIGDEQGHWLRGDVVGILCAQYLNAQTVVTTVSANTAVERCGSFDKIVRTRIGSPFVIEAMEAALGGGASGVVGFEPNGGFLVGSSIEKSGRILAPLLTRDAVLPILSLLSMSRDKGCPVSGLSRALPERFTASDRLQSFPTEQSRNILANLVKSSSAIDDLLSDLCGKSTAIDQTDGLRIHFDGGDIVHFRPSGNAPELRCYAEASSQARAALLVQRALSRIQSRSHR